ncbi:MAG: GNAT family N-acetyltransferase [Psychrobacillus sp.]
MIIIKQFDHSVHVAEEMAMLYQAVWQKEEDDFFERLQKHANYVGFIGIVAYSDTNECIGFAYGYKSEEGQYYRGLLEQELTAEEASVWLTDCFEFVELLVHPSYRGNGLGKRLTEKLVGNYPAQTALLTTKTSNQIAKALYTSLGWVVVKGDFFPSPNDGPYVIMGKDLKKGELVSKLNIQEGEER